MRATFDAVVRTVLAIFVSTVCGLVGVAAFAEDAAAPSAEGVDGALTLAKTIEQRVADGQRRLQAGHELGLVLRDTTIWSQQLLIGRWWDTVRRSMRKAHVRQESGRFGGRDEEHEYFTYSLAQAVCSNGTVTATLRIEIAVTHVSGLTEGRTPATITGCNPALSFCGDLRGGDVFRLLSSVGSDVTNLVENAIFLKAFEAYPTLAQFDMRYAPLKSRWEKYWPYGFTGEIRLQNDKTKTQAVLHFKAVTDLDSPQSSEGTPAPAGGNVRADYVQRYGRVECEVVDEGEGSLIKGDRGTSQHSTTESPGGVKASPDSSR